MIVRLTDHGHLFDLSDGSLSDEPIAIIESTGEEVYSAEQLLVELEGYDPGWRITLIITGFTDEDVKVIM